MLLHFPSLHDINYPKTILKFKQKLANRPACHSGKILYNKIKSTYGETKMAIVYIYNVIITIIIIINFGQTELYSLEG